ncbi:uncharacterized protein LOC142563372 [Dermacentor variabilis]|uniref:uncharacterized protein LOC142563372 n=1 Tax=Dermacentor variabilis TaxID=34621 RepID=UPI003F5B1029
MGPLFLIIIAFLNAETFALNFCARSNEQYLFCKYKNQPYERLCPQVKPRRCKHVAERMCICKEGFYRPRFWYPCVALRDCAKRELVHAMMLCFRDTLHLVGASKNVLDANKVKCVKAKFDRLFGKGCTRDVDFQQKSERPSSSQASNRRQWVHSA